jgi:hypothetical protein
MVVRSSLICVAACSVPEVQYQGIERQPVIELPVTPNRDLDVLFVIDNSPSMADKQLNLANNFPNFVNQLNQLEGGLPNLHLGVVSTDMGTKGSASPTPAPSIGTIGNGGCGSTGDGGKLTVGTSGSVSGPFVSDIKQADGTRVTNYTGDLSSVFGQMARLGAGGCGFEQPLAAMQAALNNNVSNAGFLRPDALLAVVFLTDEDDCSVKDPALLDANSQTLGALQSFRCTRFGVTCATGGQTTDAMNEIGVKDGCVASTTTPLLDGVAGFHDFLVGLKADPRHVLVGGIMADPQPVEIELRAQPGGGTAIPALKHSCMYEGVNGLEVGDPAVRMKSFFDLFPDRSASSTICQPDLSGPLNQIGQLIIRTVGSPCVEVPLADVDVEQPGVQVDCIVEDVLNGVPTVIEPCGPTPGSPCWRLMPDPVVCQAADHLKLIIERSTGPDPATVSRMRCQLP